MALVDFWNGNKEELAKKHVHQLIAIAGAGRLADDAVATKEFRELLGTVPSSKLADYARECLDAPFENSGLALQDIVNQIGRRLGFQVEDGLYRGKKGISGHDGIWELQNGHKIVIEVKTTDAYAINLDTVANYRKSLIAEGKAETEKASILMVVGRKDTGGLEAQIRGSRYAWDIRIISVDALIRLMELKEVLENPGTVLQISGLLIPKEYTKLDEIIELVFTTAEEVATEEEVPDNDLDDEAESEVEEEKKSTSTPVKFHDKIVERIESALGTSFIKESRTLFKAPKTNTRVLVLASRDHGNDSSNAYWFAFHPHQKIELQKAETAYVALGCGSAESLFLIPLSDFEPHLDSTWTTELKDKMYWHIRIKHRDGVWRWNMKKGTPDLDIQPYLLADSDNQ